MFIVIALIVGNISDKIVEENKERKLMIIDNIEESRDTDGKSKTDNQNEHMEILQ